jgi:hypothetical protein
MFEALSQQYPGLVQVTGTSHHLCVPYLCHIGIGSSPVGQNFEDKSEWKLTTGIEVSCFKMLTFLVVAARCIS